MNRAFAALVVLILVSVAVHSQSPAMADLPAVEQNLVGYAEKFPLEKTYLHYDKTNYSPGETIWFKAYLMEGILPSVSSKNFYVDWTDEKGALIYRSVTPLIEGTTNGQFDIPSNYSGRFIHARAYTKWMLNFDTSFLYNKDIRIMTTGTAQTQLKNTQPPSVRFFPEGGDLVEGLVTKVAFKATDQWGRPVKVKGIVVDQTGKVVDSIRVVHDGMGYLFVNPQPGEVYTANWKDEKGTAYTTALPVAKRTGVHLQVSNVGDKRFFSVTASPGMAARKVTVVGSMNQYQVFRLSKDLSAGEIRGAIPLSQLISGVLTITVLDEQYEPLAERILFVNNNEYRFQPDLNVAHWGLNKRARNEVDIEVPDSLVASLSVSVTDLGIEHDSTSNIITDLLLTSELHGEIFNPWYYFQNHADSTLQNLDLVMLTNGWRRFKWKDVAAGKNPVISYPRDTSYLELSGRVFGAMQSQLRESGNIILMMNQKGQDNQVSQLPIAPDGTFRDSSLVLFDTTTVYYQMAKSKGVDVSVKFYEDKLSPFTRNTPALGYFSNLVSDTSGTYRHNLLAAETARILKQYEGQTLSNVTVQAKTKSPQQVMDEKYTSGLFSGGDGYTFDLVNDKLAASAMNIFTYLQGKVAGLQISNASSQSPSLTWRGGAPTVYLNEMPVDIDMIATTSVNDIAYVKVFRPPFMGGFNGANGAIAIYTKKGNDVKAEPGKGLPKSLIVGYTALREFYSPNYASFKAEHERPDLRTTLYWNPMLQTAPGSNKVRVTFYNNDVAQAFRVVIEGMTRDGRLAHVEQTME